MGARKGKTQIDLWVRNALSKKYATFYFESFGNGFAQAGKPMQIGIDYDKNRLEQELIYYIEKLDINEEKLFLLFYEIFDKM
ncbi:hypothetical protein EZS27_036781 [termite gut metagenome]|uniref:Uncharacterized protein n=1 Tax=termite gut metagenome TaxID=433724 RepID=A0A5J4PUJ4_9ZZZZ